MNLHLGVSSEPLATVAPWGHYSPELPAFNPMLSAGFWVYPANDQTSQSSSWRQLSVLTISTSGFKINPSVFPGGSDGEESVCSAGYLGSIPGLGRSPEEGDDNPLQNSCLENHMDKRAWWITVCRVAKSRTWLSTNTFTFTAGFKINPLGVDKYGWRGGAGSSHESDDLLFFPMFIAHFHWLLYSESLLSTLGQDLLLN